MSTDDKVLTELMETQNKNAAEAAQGDGQPSIETGIVEAADLPSMVESAPYPQASAIRILSLQKLNKLADVVKVERPDEPAADGLCSMPRNNAAELLDEPVGNSKTHDEVPPGFFDDLMSEITVQPTEEPPLVASAISSNMSSTMPQSVVVKVERPDVPAAEGLCSMPRNNAAELVDEPENNSKTCAEVPPGFFDDLMSAITVQPTEEPPLVAPVISSNVSSTIPQRVVVKMERPDKPAAEGLCSMPRNNAAELVDEPVNNSKTYAEILAGFSDELMPAIKVEPTEAPPPVAPVISSNMSSTMPQSVVVKVERPDEPAADGLCSIPRNDGAKLVGEPVKNSKTHVEVPPGFFDDLMRAIKVEPTEAPSAVAPVISSNMSSRMPQRVVVKVERLDEPAADRLCSMPRNNAAKLVVEPAKNSKTHDDVPPGFFDDLMQAIKVEPTEKPPPVAPERIRNMSSKLPQRVVAKVEPPDDVPPGFFDDLLFDRRKESLELFALEEKYSEKLKLLAELDKQNCSNDYDSQSRDSRSPTPDHTRNKFDRVVEALSPPSTSRRVDAKRSRSVSRDSRSPTRKYMRKEWERGVGAPSPEPISRRLGDIERSHLPSRNDRSHKMDLGLRSISPESDDSSPDVELIDNFESRQLHLPEIRPDMTAMQKKKQSLMRAKLAIQYIERAKKEKENQNCFVFTSTVRKLPNNHSLSSENSYDNRSPLLAQRNVSYSFSSPSNKINLSQYGLECMPPISAKIAKLIGIDAKTIHNKLKVAKIPGRLRNINLEIKKENEEIELRPKSSLYADATTQTDNVCDTIVRKGKGIDCAVQSKPIVSSVGCQTMGIESPSLEGMDVIDELPIAAIMRDLNENQLLALHDFAELLLIPPKGSTGAYKMRQRMQDIYKLSQLPI